MQADARYNDAARGQVDNQIRYARIEKLLEQILAALTKAPEGAKQ
jgi:hypothetical protein